MSDHSVLRLGTRASALAMVQARMVVDALATVGVAAHLTTIVTDGDRRSPDTPWGEGAFVGAIERALLDGTIDLAVHSAKDVPTDEDPRLHIAAYMARASPDDVLVLAAGSEPGPLEALPQGSRVGTDSPRRSAFLRAMRPDLRVHPLHGNVDTRLRRLDDGETDALVLAAAGLTRLGRSDRISAVLPTALMPPAPGQGALAVQVRAADAATARVVASLDDASTRRSVSAERALLMASGGGCRAPLGALATASGDGLHLLAGIATPDGAVRAQVSLTADAAMADSATVAAVLQRLTDEASMAAAALGWPRVVVTRAATDSAPMRLALVDHGLTPIAVPCIAIERAAGAAPAKLATALDGAAWIVLTSRHAADAVVSALDGSTRSRIAVVGPSTARVVRAAGISVEFMPSVATAAALADTIPLRAGERVAVIRGDLAGDRLADHLQARGADVVSSIAYCTIEAPETSRASMHEALINLPAAVVLTSGSTARGWLALAERIGQGPAALAVPCIAIGPSTATEARRLGLSVLAQSRATDPGSVAETVADAIAVPQEST